MENEIDEMRKKNKHIDMTHETVVYNIYNVNINERNLSVRTNRIEFCSTKLCGIKFSMKTVLKKRNIVCKIKHTVDNKIFARWKIIIQDKYCFLHL